MHEKLDKTQLQEFYIEQPDADNWSMAEQKLKEIYEELQWKPELDVATNIAGTNAHAPTHYSAYEDALKQVEHFKGKKIICNPAWTLAD